MPFAYVTNNDQSAGDTLKLAKKLTTKIGVICTWCKRLNKRKHSPSFLVTETDQLNFRIEVYR